MSRIKAILYIMFFVGCPVFYLNAQVASVTSGNWNNTSTWDCSCIPDFNSGTITISSFTTVTIPNGFTADADEIIVDSDGALNVNSGGRLIVRDGTGDDLTITIGDGFFTFDGLLTVDAGGILENRGTIVSSSSNLIINGTFQHNRNGGSIPEASWNSGSLLEITGITNTAPTGLNQVFYNITWNSAQTASVSLGGSLLQVDNDFIINNTGTNRALILHTSGTGSLTIGRDLIVQNAASFGISQSGTYTLNVNRNLTVNSTATNSLLLTSSGNVTINVQGNVTKANTGSLVMSSGSGTGTLNVYGNFSLTGGAVNETSSGSGTIVFAGSGVQTFTGGGTFNNTINFIVNASSSLSLGTHALTGSGAFTLNGTLQVGSTDSGGAIQNSTTNGNIRVSGARTFNAGSSIVYNGSSAQFIGNGHPTTSGVNCTINNASGVSLASNATIGGNLTLTAGNLTVGSNTLTLGGNISAGSNNIVVSSGSSLVINGSGNLGNFPFPAGPQTFANFTLNRTSGSVTFANQVTITGSVVLNAGDLIFNGQTLELSGTLSATGGNLYGNSSSTLIISGSGAFGELPFASGGNTIHTLTINRSSGTVSLDNALTISNTLNLNAGELNNISGLRLSNGATLRRNSTGQLSGTAVLQSPGETYNVTYQGSSGFSTGVELPTTTADHLGTLTIDGGPVTLTQNIIVNGDLNLLNSTFNANGFNIEMAGSSRLWNKQTGVFTPGSGVVTISGNITVQATSSPQFGNLTVNSGATLTAYSGTMNISGNFQLDVGCTFNHNNGTLSFNGSATQVLAGGAKTFNNINVNKSAGNLQLSSTVNLRGALTVSSSTTIESGGYLVLLSTSDGTSGNARIGSLPSGASITGNVIVQRYMADEGRIYRYISAPVSGYSVASLQAFVPITGSFSGASTCTGCLNNPSMYRYNETISGNADAGWEPFPVSSNTETLQTGRGYAVFVRDDIISGNVRIDWQGSIHQGSISLPVSYTNTGNPGGDGWNLVGNPYPSSIDWDFASGWSKTNISGTIAVRDNGSGTFRYWDGSAGSFANGEIATGQGFWVRATGSSPALTINELAKTSATATFYRVSEEPVDVLEMVLTNGQATDHAYIRYRQDALNTLDDYDGPKLRNAIFDLFTFSADSIPMAINAVNNWNCEGPVYIGLRNMANGSYRISLNPQGAFGQYIYRLEDAYARATEILLPGEEYVFEVNDDPQSKSSKRLCLKLFPYVPVHLEFRDGALYSNYTEGNQWFLNGLPIEGATGQMYVPDTSGEYSLRVKIGVCSYQAPETYTHVITSIDPENTEIISVFPNPVSTKLHIKLQNEQPAQFMVVSSNGTVTHAVKEDGEGKIRILDVAELPEGFYLLVVNQGNRIYRIKFLKLSQ